MAVTSKDRLYKVRPVQDIFTLFIISITIIITVYSIIPTETDSLFMILYKHQIKQMCVGEGMGGTW
jgi:hypothetical protein